MLEAKRELSLRVIIQAPGTIIHMSFVYTGKGKKGGNDQDSPKECSKQACNIQWCLARAKLETREKICRPYIDEWKSCVKKHNELKMRNGNEQERGVSTSVNGSRD